MPKSPQETLLALPPRPVRPHERDLLIEWLSRAGNVPSAYVSDRQSDDPAMYRRIVIAAGPGNQPTHLIQRPTGMNMWVKLTIAPQLRVEMFESLATALNSIQRVLILELPP